MKAASAPRASTLFLQAIVVLVGVGALAFLLWEPNVEGVNANATTFAQVYLDDPFLAYAYLASIPFFVALYQAFRLLGHGTFSRDSVRALRTIRYCGLALIAGVIGGEIWIILGNRGEDDIAGGVAMGVFMILFFSAMTGGAMLLEQRARAVGSKS